MAYGSMVTGQLFSGDDTLSEKFFKATSDRVVGPVTRSLYTYDMHATSHAARDIVQVELPQRPDQHFCGVALKRSCVFAELNVPFAADPLARFPSDLDGDTEEVLLYVPVKVRCDAVQRSGRKRYIRRFERFPGKEGPISFLRNPLTVYKLWITKYV